MAIKNRLRHQDLHKIVDVFNKQIEVPKYSRMVSVAEIETNDYNLNIPRYIDSTEAEDVQDIEAHLLGGIPNYDIDALDNYWQVFPTLKQQLFEAGPRAGYSLLRVDVAQIKPIIFTHQEFMAYIQTVIGLFEQWQTANVPCLRNLSVGSHPKQLIEELSEDLLRVFAAARLIDRYDVYQHLMSYWTDTMQDDVYMIAMDGWNANSDLIPPQLIINRYFAAEQQSIEKLEAARDTITNRLAELVEEYGDDGGLLEEAKNENGRITKASVKVRLKDIFGEADATDEQEILNEYLDLLEKETEASKKIKDAQKALDAKVAASYNVLSEDEVKTLVVEDKWLTAFASDVQTELNRISQTMTGRIKELAERYATPLPKLTEEVEELSTKVEAHLQKMGFVW
jgi:type I restriction enzyme M protein